MPRPRLHLISSAVVTTLPGREAEISGIVAAMPGVEVAARGRGKVVIVLEGGSAGEVGDRLTAIAAMDGVVSANMVFEHVEELEATTP
jgi:Uncharacterized protein involved in formation of periplasmic nitrate reductase